MCVRALCIVLLSVSLGIDSRSASEEAPADLSAQCVAAIEIATGRLARCTLKASAKFETRRKARRLSRDKSRCQAAFEQRVAEAEDQYGAEHCTAHPATSKNALKRETRNFANRAQDLIKGHLSPDLLFVLKSERAAFDGSFLTLEGVDGGTIFFSDLPEQTSGSVSTGAFLDALSKGVAIFESEPPNANLSCVLDSERVNFVVVLERLMLRGGRLVFETSGLASSAASQIEACDEAVLFIDGLDALSADLNLGTGACSGVDFAAISEALSSSPTWTNWSQNLASVPPLPDDGYYFEPTTREELLAIACQAKAAGKQLRVSGQRHSQPALVHGTNTSSSNASVDSNVWLVDLRCYSDLETAEGTSRMVLTTLTDPVTREEKQVVVANAGVREDELAEFLQNNNRMLPTVTAGGFFSLGGVVAVDVHGATVDEGILAETVEAMEVLRTYPDVGIDTVDAATMTPDGDPALPYERVALGSLGIMTSLAFRVLDRPFEESITSSYETKQFSGASARDDFASYYGNLLFNDPDQPRVESFFNPYTDTFLVLKWNLPDPLLSENPVPAVAVNSSCDEALGAGFVAGAGAIESPVQNGGTKLAARSLISTSLSVIQGQVDTAAAEGRTHWLNLAAQVVFMSYFIELPSNDEEGLKTAWDALQVVVDRIDASSEFRPVLPNEFRFVRSGDTLLAGTYTGDEDSLFVSIEVLGFANPAAATTGVVGFDQNLLDFFGNIEMAWVEMGGAPHSGKMFGFFDPENPGAGTTEPFNPAYVDWLKTVKKAAEIGRFNTYRRSIDPEGTFTNQLIEQLVVCDDCS